MMQYIEKVNKKHCANGDIKMSSPRINNKKAVTCCTYGGPHTGLNEGVVVPKYLGQLLDHLGFEILAEWHFPGAFQLPGFTQYSHGGRMGDISGRPNTHDLQGVDNLVQGILYV